VAYEDAVAIGDIGADKPALIACGRDLQAVRYEVIGYLAGAAVGDAAAEQREVDIVVAPVPAAIAAAEHIVAVDALEIEVHAQLAAAAAGKHAEPEVRRELAVDADRAAIGGVGGALDQAVFPLPPLAAKAGGPHHGVVDRHG